MLILVGLLLAIAGAVLFNACFPLPRYYENLMAIPLLVMAQIVLLSQALSIIHLLSTEGYLVGQVLLLSISGGLWWWRGKPAVAAVWRFNVRRTLQAMTPYIYLSILALIALIGAGLMALEGAQTQRYFIDSDVYHLPRAVFWLQNNTAEHFVTQNFRMTEFPPNASFVYAWMMALDGLDTGLNLPQFVAALAGVLATIGLARAAGFRLDASIFAGLLLLFNTELLLQLKEAQIDVITGFLTAVALYFVVRAIQAQRDDVPLTDNIALVYMAIAFGLAAGTKFTVAFILPGAALAFVVYAVGILRTNALPILSACFVAAVSGFIVFGSYNYVLNTLSFGNPVSSKDIRANSSDLVNRGDVENVDQLLDPAANLVRYLYQIVGVEAYDVILPVTLVELVTAKLSLFELIFGENGLGISYRVDDTPLVNSVPAGTYQLLFAVPFVLSPFLLMYFLIRSSQAARYRLPALYLFLVIGWILVLSSITAWSGFKMRLFQVVVPFLAAAVFPWLYSRKRYAALWLVPILIVALFNLLFANTIRRANLQADVTEYLQIADTLIPPDSNVGFVSEQMGIFPLQRDIPDAHFEYIAADNIRSALISGEVDVVMTDASHCDETVEGKERVELFQPSFLYPNCIYTDPDRAAIAEHVERQTAGDTVSLRIEPGLYMSRIEQNLYLRVPDDYLQAQTGDVSITVYFESDLSSTEFVHIQCAGDPVPAEAISIADDRIQFTLPAGRLLSDASSAERVFCHITERSYSRIDYAQVAPATP